MIKRGVIDYKRKYLEMSVLNFLSRRQVNNINNWFLEDFKVRGIIPMVYSCQKCGTMVVSETELEIVQSKTPQCNSCLGNITISKKMVDGYIEEHHLG